MFWIREIVGWVFIGLGVTLFGVCYFVLIRNQKIVAAGPTVLIAIFLFRGGIHLLKVAVSGPTVPAAGTEAPASSAFGAFALNPAQVERQ